ncbi:MAG: hypothetical protein ACLTEE_11420 [Anaerobutyricum hallii]
MSTDPKAERSYEKKNTESNGLLYDTCQHIRYIRDTKFFKLSFIRILIDAFSYNAIQGWHYLREE